MKNQLTYVEIKTVTWTKDSHGLFDYESQNVNYTKAKVESSSKIYKEGSEIMIKNLKDLETSKDKETSSGKSLFSIIKENDKSDNFALQVDENNQFIEEQKTNSLFLIVRSLKNDDGTQRGYNLELGDVIRLGRIEYRVLEFMDHNQMAHSVNNERTPIKCPFKMLTKDVVQDPTVLKPQCRICLMDEHDSHEILVNPCNCKGTSGMVHIHCLQEWINSKSKKKSVNTGVTCYYWNKLNCEVCGVSLPDFVNFNGQKIEITPIQRPATPYLLLERVFYDKSKENTQNTKMMVLIGIDSITNQIKLGRGHECDLRENDISVSRFHAYIKYHNGGFTILDNNSKFGTLILLRKPHRIEKRKIAVQIGRTVLTFSLKHSSINNIPIFKIPMLMEKFYKAQSPKSMNTAISLSKHSTSPFSEKQDLNGSFLD